MANMITKQEAIRIATDDAGGFLGTWVNGELKANEWHINSMSKSAQPPMYYVIDGNTGEIKLKLDNRDAPKHNELLEKYNNRGEE
jgi:hypothetical protein